MCCIPNWSGDVNKKSKDLEEVEFQMSHLKSCLKKKLYFFFIPDINDY